MSSAWIHIIQDLHLKIPHRESAGYATATQA